LNSCVWRGILVGVLNLGGVWGDGDVPGGGCDKLVFLRDTGI